MTSTTLITFLLRTSPDVRKVELLGSWDNFIRPYPMDPDRRIGAGHWRGCHTFTDIICDGDSQNMSPGRNGALKMGGTYWYYYRLDGVDESYNDAEPITTLCPFLPGQPVNVLIVPIALPTTNTHSRDPSTDSIRSEKRTMDPQDKYLNPRTPPQPRLPPLKTSPPLCQDANPSWSSLLGVPMESGRNRSISQPTSAVVAPGVRLMAKEKMARSMSPPRGLLAAFKQLASTRSPGSEREFNERDQSLDALVDTSLLSVPPAGRFEPPSATVNTSNPASNLKPSVTSPTGNIGKLPFRRPEFETDRPITRPLWSRRASRTGYREPSPLHSQPSSACSEDSGNNNGILSLSQLQKLEILEQALSQQNTPMIFKSVKTVDVSRDGTPKNPNTEKRLPTLPNTPSSILDSELRAMDAQNNILDEEALRSHFSDASSIAVSEKFTQSTWEKSRFSEWSIDTELISPASMTSESTFNCEHMTRQHSPTEKPRSANDLPFANVLRSSEPTTPTMNDVSEMFDPPMFHKRSSNLPSPFSVEEGIHVAADDLALSPLTIDDLEDVEKDSKRHAAMFRGIESIKSFRTSLDEPTLPWKVHSVRKHSSVDEVLSLPQTRTGREAGNRPSLGQSAAMKELMDELSYLGDMIKAGL